MRKMSGVSDYFVIASGTSVTHTRAIADHIAHVVKAKRGKVWRIEGLSDASWILLDCSDVVAHIFLTDTRRFYDLENLWKKAPKERFKDKVKPDTGLKSKAGVRPRPVFRKGAKKTAGRRKKS